MQCQVEFDGGKDGTFELKLSGCFLEMDELKDGGFFCNKKMKSSQTNAPQLNGGRIKTTNS